jgi:phosphoribosylglycinamide formyltransferase 1
MRIGVLASGGGSNLQSIIDACGDGRLDGEVCLVVSNNSASGALDRAHRAGINTRHISGKTHPSPIALDKAILSAFADSGIEYLLLAGYMKKLYSETLKSYRNRIFNIHPALLPAFGGHRMYGMAVHRAVIASGAAVSGPTVHLVTAEYDEGPVLAQKEVSVLASDDPESLQQRVLEAEHRLYPATLDAVSKGIIVVHDEVPPTVVRPLCLESDFDGVAEVVRTAFRTPAERFNITKDNCPAHPSFVNKEKLVKITNNRGTFFAAYRKSEMTGCVAVEPSPDEEGTWYIEKLAVLPDLRLTGLGSLLLDHACRAISVFGGRRISIALIDADQGLKNWYRRRKFTKTGTRSFPHLPFTVCFMARNLDNPGGKI